MIGLTETRILKEKDHVTNTDIPGYTFFSQPSLSNAGGVGFFVSDHLSFIMRADLSVSTVDYEALWIEIHSNMQKNLICSVIYRHPNGNIDNFMNYLNCTMDKINRENSLCIVMGDFIICNESDLINDIQMSDWTDELTESNDVNVVFGSFLF